MKKCDKEKNHKGKTNVIQFDLSWLSQLGLEAVLCNRYPTWVCFDFVSYKNNICTVF